MGRYYQEVKESNMIPILHSEYQEDIFDFIKNGTGHGMVEAVAGSGKTYTIIQAAKLVQGDIGFVAFNKHIATELAEKLPECDVRTLHSLGMRAVTSAFGRVQVDTSKIYKLLKPKLERFDWKESNQLNQSAQKIIGLLKGNLLEPTSQNIKDLISYHGIECPRDWDFFVKLIEETLLKANFDTKKISFDDMVSYPIEYDLPCHQYDFLLVDEAQDLNPAQLTLILKSIKPDGRIIAVGDRKQCQPEGTMVYKTGIGYAPIEEIKVGDQLLTYYDGYFAGKKNQGRKVLEVSKRKYTGKLIKIEAGGYNHLCTPEHKCLIQMVKKEGYAVYVMNRGNKARVGVTGSKYNAAGSISQRLRDEKADNVWIIDIFETKKEAELLECLIAYEYGLPQNIFQRKWETIENTIRDQDWNNKFWDLFPENIISLEKCLLDFNRKKEFPFAKIQKNGGEFGQKKGILYSFVTQSCNLISGWMNVCTFSGEQHGRRNNWRTINISHEEYDGFVHSIKLEERWRGHPTYIAQGIVTHNSIYGFRGADADSIPKIIEKLDATVLPLSITYRCPTKVVDIAKKIVPEIQAAPDAVEGEVKTIEEHQLLDEITTGDLALCRYNAPLVAPAFHLIKNGIKAIIKGKDIGKNLIKIIKDLKARDIENLEYKLNQWAFNEVNKAEKRNQNPQMVIDKTNCIYSFLDGDIKSIEELIRHIESIFSDGKGEVTFSSIHKAKGLEADNVFIIQPELMPCKYATQEWEQVQEENILYVAVTRAKKKLIYVMGNK